MSTNQPEFPGMADQLRPHLRYLREIGITEIPLRRTSRPSAEEALKKIREEIGDCQRCPLSRSRTHIVFGVGTPRARLMFVGEGPGRDEDIRGEPFVGRAGQLLTRMIEAMKMKREEVYIANIVKCRPPDNRYPEPDEVSTCYPFLLKQIAAIGPTVIVALGNLAAQTLLGTKEGITRLRGSFHDFHGTPLMPTYHPAFLLRNPEKKREVWEDLKKVMEILGLRLQARGEGPPPPGPL